MQRNWMLWPGPMSPERAYALLPWRECSRARFARQRQGERRDDDNVTSSLLAFEKFTCPSRFRGKWKRARIRDLSRRDAGLPSARVL